MAGNGSNSQINAAPCVTLGLHPLEPPRAPSHIVSRSLNSIMPAKRKASVQVAPPSTKRMTTRSAAASTTPTPRRRGEPVDRSSANNGTPAKVPEGRPIKISSKMQAISEYTLDLFCSIALLIYPAQSPNRTRIVRRKRTKPKKLRATKRGRRKRTLLLKGSHSLIFITARVSQMTML